MKKLIIGLMALTVVGCTDAQRGKVFSIGDSAKVTCYSGGLKIYDGFSTGKVSNEQSSDGYFFVDKELNKTVEVSGNCVIIYNY